MGNLQRVDSMDISISSDLITITNKDKFQRQNVLHGELVAESFSGQRFPGLNGISVGYSSGNNTLIKVSAKLMGNDYAEGINKNNIEKAFDTIKKFGALDFDNQEFYDNAVLRSVDVFKNVKVNPEYGVGRYVDALKTRAIPPNRIDKTAKWGKKSVVWKRNVSSYKERMIAYDKVMELMKHTNKEFLMLHDKSKIMADYENVLRFETNTGASGAMKKIRERFNTEDNNLCSVLESESNVLWKIYERMVSEENSNQLNIWDNHDTSAFDSWSDCVSEIGLRTIIEMFDGNYDSVKSYMLRFYGEKSNPTREIKKIKQRCIEYHQRKEALKLSKAHLYQVGDLVGELESKLKVA